MPQTLCRGLLMKLQLSTFFGAVCTDESGAFLSVRRARLRMLPRTEQVVRSVCYTARIIQSAIVAMMN